MYSLPISDTKAISIDDEDEDEWHVHFVDFETKTFESFSVAGLETVQYAFFDPKVGQGIIWIVTQGTLFAISLEEKELFEVEPPPEKFFIYSVISDGKHAYVSGEHSNLWRFALPDFTWEQIQTPEPEAEEVDDEKEQSRRNKAYAAKYPPFYSGTQVGDDFVFCGALGALARVRGTAVETKLIEGKPRFVKVQTEGGRLVLGSDGKRGEVRIGDFDGGFETIWGDNLPAFHRTAVHDGRRYLGVAEYPPSNVHNLYTLENGKPQAVEIEGPRCAREVFGLVSMSASETALWLVDGCGVFRFANGTWTLVDDDDLRAGTWPREDHKPDESEDA